MGRKRKVDLEKEKITVELPRPTFVKDPQCPRCGTYETTVVSTVKNRQYRKCSHPACRKNFTSDAIDLTDM